MYIKKDINYLLAILTESVLKKEYPTCVPVNHGVEEENFFIEFQVDEKISSNDFNKIERLIHKVISGAQEIHCTPISHQNALTKFKDNKFLSYLVHEANQAEYYLVSVNQYETILLEPLELKKTNVIKALKLLSIGGTYWLGDAEQPTLIRLIGVGFDDKKDFDEYMLEYQERMDRDHRKIGKELDLFTFDLLAGQGLPIWLNKGTIIRKQIRNFLSELEFKYNFEDVYTPILGNIDLYKKSGHWEHYRENMFSPIKVDNEELVLRPMTCPHHILVYKRKPYSYKQLPIRLCEESMLHRYESSGGLTGLERVREMILEDTHIFCTPEQIEQEVLTCYNIIKDAHKGFGTEIFQVDLSLHDPDNKEKFHKDPKMWEVAENSLRQMLKKHNIPFVEKIGEAAFYGPKIDFQVKTSLNRIITMSTIQLDFLLPMKFELEYKDKEGEFNRPIMIHLGIIGTYERLVSIILEQTKGVLPLWLTPDQVVIIPLNNELHWEYASQIHQTFKNHMIRSQLDDRDERMNKKIREAQMSKIPYQIIIGDKEIQDHTISVREYGSEETHTYELSQFLDIILKRIADKK